MPDFTLNHLTFGEEELIAYSQYYCYDIDSAEISFFFSNTQNRN
jgi:hyperpolarization activated cyclic nucleotide-gated potassium channel 2